MGILCFDSIALETLAKVIDNLYDPEKKAFNRKLTRGDSSLIENFYDSLSTLSRAMSDLIPESMEIHGIVQAIKHISRVGELNFEQIILLNLRIQHAFKRCINNIIRYCKILMIDIIVNLGLEKQADLVRKAKEIIKSGRYKDPNEFWQWWESEAKKQAVLTVEKLFRFVDIIYEIQSPYKVLNTYPITRRINEAISSLYNGNYLSTITMCISAIESYLKHTYYQIMELHGGNPRDRITCGALIREFLKNPKLSGIIPDRYVAALNYLVDARNYAVHDIRVENLLDIDFSLGMYSVRKSVEFLADSEVLEQTITAYFEALSQGASKETSRRIIELAYNLTKKVHDIMYDSTIRYLHEVYPYLHNIIESLKVF